MVCRFPLTIASRRAKKSQPVEGWLFAVDGGLGSIEGCVAARMNAALRIFKLPLVPRFVPRSRTHWPVDRSPSKGLRHTRP